jgi:hypothetical protein
MDYAEYCRAIETHLCRKNDGHLVRIVGPVFEQVCGWARQGVPLKVALKGIDVYCERYYAKGPRRRPVRVEFCEADVLELFDAWRRAVGVSAVPQGSETSADAPEEAPRRKPALAAHIDRAIAMLVARQDDRLASDRIAETVRALDPLAADARSARGDARARIVARLAEIDRELMASATGAIDAEQREAFRREAADELSGFADRMAPDVRARAIDAAYRRLVRESLSLPTLEYE